MNQTQSYSLRGVGIDIVDVARVQKFVRQHRIKLRQFLNKTEYHIFQKSKLSYAAFALIFATKEAASKAMGKSLMHPGAFKEFEVSYRAKKLSVLFTGTPRKNHLSFKLLPFEAPGHLGVMAWLYQK